MREAELARNVEELCKYLGVRYYHSWTSVHSAPGWPDYCFVTPDHRFLVRELKTDKGRLTVAQEAWLAALRAAGVNADVWRPDDWPGRIKWELSPYRRGVE